MKTKIMADFQICISVHLKLWRVGARERKSYPFLTFILFEENFFNICVLPQCIVYWKIFQKIHVLLYIKKTLIMQIFWNKILIKLYIEMAKGNVQEMKVIGLSVRLKTDGILATKIFQQKLRYFITNLVSPQNVVLEKSERDIGINTLLVHFCIQTLLLEFSILKSRNS